MKQEIIFYTILGLLVVTAIGSAVYVWNQSPVQLSPGSGEAISPLACICGEKFIFSSPVGMMGCSFERGFAFSPCQRDSFK